MWRGRGRGQWQEEPSARRRREKEEEDSEKEYLEYLQYVMYNGNPLQYSCLENPMDRGAWQATVHRVPKSWTRQKQLSTHACIYKLGWKW